MRFVSKEAQISNMVAAILNSFQTTTLGYGSFWAILFWAKQAPNSEMIALEIVKWIISWKKNRFCWPCEGCQVRWRFFSFPPISSRTEWRHINTAWLPRQFQNDGVRSRFFRDAFLQDSGYFRGWNFGEWKSWMFTCYRWTHTKKAFWSERHL